MGFDETPHHDSVFPWQPVTAALRARSGRTTPRILHVNPLLGRFVLCRHDAYERSVFELVPSVFFWGGGVETVATVSCISRTLTYCTLIIGNKQQTNK